MRRKLIQTTVPDLAFKKLEEYVARKGLTVAAWMRQQVLKAVGVDGLGKEIK